MIFIGQAGETVFWFGKGCSLKIECEEDGCHVRGYGNGEACVELGCYEDIQAAKYVLREMADTVINRQQKYYLPNGDNVLKKTEFELKREQEKKRIKELLENGTALEKLKPGLSDRYFNNLHRSGFYIVEEIESLSDGELLTIRGVGSAGVQEIRNAISDLRQKEGIAAE